MASWRTTATGIITAVIVILTSILAVVDIDPATKPDIDAVMAAIKTLAAGFTMSSLVYAWGWWKARDNNVTSRQAGAE